MNVWLLLSYHGDQDLKRIGMFGALLLTIGLTGETVAIWRDLRSGK